ncbi:hypothetical protein Vadar_033326 [Vaccinium darrowii]|uniref:Uncharacterized protein n=1 Tax=Vaccinium darrowii TaxID=229202 RepID=A0ACB7XM24_9ERIC|nr:hypothetical protein Vadar_033326 [Vaccinium darrowii]
MGGRKGLKGAIEIDLCSPEKKGEEEVGGTPVRGVFCMKRKKGGNMREIENREDCFILDFDPNDDDSLHLSPLNMSNNPNSPDLSVLAEKGQVACRDYPHPRHLCVKNCFEKTPHENHCKLCFCFVCDTAAPCKNWSGGNGHCHAINNEAWKSQRKKTRRRKE